MSPSTAEPPELSPVKPISIENEYEPPTPGTALAELIDGTINFHTDDQKFVSFVENALENIRRLSDRIEFHQVLSASSHEDIEELYPMVSSDGEDTDSVDDEANLEENMHPMIEQLEQIGFEMQKQEELEEEEAVKVGKVESTLSDLLLSPVVNESLPSTLVVAQEDSTQKLFFSPELQRSERDTDKDEIMSPRVLEFYASPDSSHYSDRKTTDEIEENQETFKDLVEELDAEILKEEPPAISPHRANLEQSKTSERSVPSTPPTSFPSALPPSTASSSSSSIMFTSPPRRITTPVMQEIQELKEKMTIGQVLLFDEKESIKKEQKQQATSLPLSFPSIPAPEVVDMSLNYSHEDAGGGLLATSTVSRPPPASAAALAPTTTDSIPKGSSSFQERVVYPSPIIAERELFPTVTESPDKSFSFFQHNLSSEAVNGKEREHPDERHRHDILEDLMDEEEAEAWEKLFDLIERHEDDDESDDFSELSDISDSLYLTQRQQQLLKLRLSRQQHANSNSSAHPPLPPQLSSSSAAPGGQSALINHDFIKRLVDLSLASRVQRNKETSEAPPPLMIPPVIPSIETSTAARDSLLPSTTVPSASSSSGSPLITAVPVAAYPDPNLLPRYYDPSMPPLLTSKANQRMKAREEVFQRLYAQAKPSRYRPVPHKPVPAAAPANPAPSSTVKNNGNPKNSKEGRDGKQRQQPPITMTNSQQTKQMRYSRPKPVRGQENSSRKPEQMTLPVPPAVGPEVILPAPYIPATSSFPHGMIVVNLETMLLSYQWQSFLEYIEVSSSSTPTSVPLPHPPVQSGQHSSPSRPPVYPHHHQTHPHATTPSPHRIKETFHLQQSSDQRLHHLFAHLSNCVTLLIKRALEKNQIFFCLIFLYKKDSLQSQHNGPEGGGEQYQKDDQGSEEYCRKYCYYHIGLRKLMLSDAFHYFYGVPRDNCLSSSADDEEDEIIDENAASLASSPSTSKPISRKNRKINGLTAMRNRAEQQRERILRHFQTHEISMIKELLSIRFHSIFTFLIARHYSLSFHSFSFLLHRFAPFFLGSWSFSSSKSKRSPSIAEERGEGGDDEEEKDPLLLWRYQGSTSFLKYFHGMVKELLSSQGIVPGMMDDISTVSSPEFWPFQKVSNASSSRLTGADVLKIRSFYQRNHIYIDQTRVNSVNKGQANAEDSRKELLYEEHLSGRIIVIDYPLPPLLSWSILLWESFHPIPRIILCISISLP